MYKGRSFTPYARVAAPKSKTHLRSGSSLLGSTRTSIGVSGQVIQMCKTVSSGVPIRSARISQCRAGSRDNSARAPCCHLKPAKWQKPSIEGPSAEFYKSFWDVIGGDLLEVVSNSLKVGRLPLSCRQAVITLLLKKEYLMDIKNWRP